MPISNHIINPPSSDIKSEGVSNAATDKLEIKQVSNRPSIKKRFLSLFQSIRLKSRSKNGKEKSVANKPLQLAKPAQVAKMAVTAPQQNADSRLSLMQAIRDGVELRSVTADQKARPVTPNADTSFLQEVLKKMQDARMVLSSQSTAPSTVQGDIQPPVVLTMASGTLPPPPPPPPLPPPAPILPVGAMASDVVAPSGGGKDALLNAITGFNKNNLKKAVTGIKNDDVQAPVTKNEPMDELYSDELLKTAPNMNQANRELLCQQISDYVVNAMEVNWEGILLDQYGQYADIDALEAAMNGQSKSISSYWAEVKRFPDLWKRADVVSDQPFQTQRKGVATEAMSRLDSGKTRLFRSDSSRGAIEMKKGEAILDGARRTANQLTTNEEKLNLLGSNYRQSALKVLTEMPFMEGFATKNGKDAQAKLEKQFMANIHGADSLKADISRFLSTHMKTGFEDFTFLGQEALVKKQSELIKALQLKLGYSNS
ncbi:MULTISPECIES: WH2 domain-containing protein [unclassified Shewanella]|uniref:WH2 domain-containing protein n=1 Tax=unclassified Shewanella TaxID=196818 RepID=UPI0021D9B436|nr:MULTISPECIES: WH2 domain-containing protein [unclassified Shewanella]MCU8034858.1 actin-binding protein [Shewanella sp. SM71]MCU8096727.1 actin-binding protein [Shewanella sp. SM102]